MLLVNKQYIKFNLRFYGKYHVYYPTYDLLVEYFNTETIKFQIPVPMCQISDGPGFGQEHMGNTA